MNEGLSISHLILQASPLVQGVMSLLALASVISWSLILSKRALFARTRKEADKFEDRFWSGGNLSDLYDQVRRSGDDDGIIAIFTAGFDEYLRHQQTRRASAEEALAAVQRQMRVAMARELERLEGGLALLATIGSTSPYVGLFGTVWGIMTAFVALGQAKQVSLAMVAPGIAEALIATAMGLFAAIPAVIAYNFFTRTVDTLDVRFSTFSEEMTGIIERGLRSEKV